MLSRTTMGWLFFIVALVAAPGRGAAQDDLEDRVNAGRGAADAAKFNFAQQNRKLNDEQIQALEKRLDSIKDWTSVQFELNRDDKIDKPKAMTDLVSRWQKRNEREIHQFLEFGDDSRGPIESGRALNRLLDRIGPAAYQRAQLRKMDSTAVPPGPDQAANEKITPEMVQQLSWRDRTLGSKASGKFNQDPIDVDWPVVLRRPQWEKHCAAIESARKQVLEELKAGEGVSPESDERLRTAIAALNQDYAAFRKVWVRGDRPHDGSQALEYRQLCQGGRHIEKLVGSVYQVVEATRYGEVVPEDFAGGTFEEFLAHMYGNSIEFAPATKGPDQKAHYQMFQRMARYYLELDAVAKLQERLEDEIGRLKEANQETVELALGKSLTAAQQAELMLESSRFVRSLLKDEE